MSSSPSTSPPRRSFFRFSLRMLLVAMLVLGCGLGWYGKEWTRLRHQRAIAARFKARKAYVDYDPRLPPGQERDVSKIPLAMRAGHMLFGDDAFSHISAVWLHRETNREDLELLATLPRLEELKVTAPPDDAFELIARNARLQRLTLNHCKLSPAHYSVLQKLPELTKLYLEGRELDDESLSGLPALRNLETLLVRSPNVTSQSLPRIVELTRLQTLALDCASIGDDNIALLKALKNLHILHLDGTSVTSASLSHLRELKQLHWLRLDDTRIGDSGFEQLTELPLTQLSLSNTAVGSQSLSEIAKIRTLQQLSLGGRTSTLSDANLVQLAQLTKLEFLNLSSNAITDQGLVHLQSLKNLRRLHIDSRATRSAVAQLQKDFLPQCTFDVTDPAGNIELPAIAP